MKDEGFSTFTFGEGTTHNIGDANCPNCWPNYPRRCVCGGLIHAHFGDENYDGDYWLFVRCDKCGDEYEEADDE